jgi:hypothetical protein
MFEEEKYEVGQYVSVFKNSFQTLDLISSLGGSQENERF